MCRAQEGSPTCPLSWETFLEVITSNTLYYSPVDQCSIFVLLLVLLNGSLWKSAREFRTLYKSSSWALLATILAAHRPIAWQRGNAHNERHSTSSPRTRARLPVSSGQFEVRAFLISLLLSLSLWFDQIHSRRELRLVGRQDSWSRRFLPRIKSTRKPLK